MMIRTIIRTKHSKDKTQPRYLHLTHRLTYPVEFLELAHRSTKMARKKRLTFCARLLR